MAMTMIGEVQLPASRGAVWAMLKRTRHAEKLHSGLRVARQGLGQRFPGGRHEGDVHTPSSDSRLARAARSLSTLPLSRSKPCRMADELRTNLSRGPHLLTLQSGGHRAPPAPSRKALRMPREAMSDISSWPKPKHSPAMWSALSMGLLCAGLGFRWLRHAFGQWHARGRSSR